MNIHKDLLVDPLHKDAMLKWLAFKFTNVNLNLGDIEIRHKYYNDISMVYLVIVSRLSYKEFVRFSTDPLDDSMQSASL